MATCIVAGENRCAAPTGLDVFLKPRINADVYAGLKACSTRAHSQTLSFSAGCEAVPFPSKTQNTEFFRRL
jgi:hypothetical protein